MLSNGKGREPIFPKGSKMANVKKTVQHEQHSTALRSRVACSMLRLGRAHSTGRVTEVIRIVNFAPPIRRSDLLKEPKHPKQVTMSMMVFQRSRSGPRILSGLV